MSSYKKYIKPLIDVKQEQNPVNKTILKGLFNLCAITKPKKNEPIIEITKLLLI